MNTPITPLRMPVELKSAAKKQADSEGLSLSQWIYKAIRYYIKKN